MIISLSRTRKIMGKKADKYSNKQLEDAINVLTILADLAIDNFIAKKKLTQKPK